MSRYETLLNGLIRLRWFILAALAIYLSLFEAAEHGAIGLEIFLKTEIYIYFLSLFLVGLSLELVAKSNRKLKSTIKILDQKHRLSSKLALETDWENLVNRLAQVPKMIEGIEESTLLLYNQAHDRYDPVSRWAKNETQDTGTADTESFAVCIEKYPGKFHLLKTDDSPAQTASDVNVYCLHIPYGRSVTAMLRMRMAPGATPVPDQVEMINHLVNEMAAGLTTGQERKNLADLREAEAARTERRMVSRYLHDHISQNLGYLSLKMDQFSSPMPQPPLEDLKKDFAQMRDAVNETYEIVRSSLETMQWAAEPHLSNLVQDYADKVAKRAKFEALVSEDGEAVDLPLQMTQKIFYIIREALSNVEKHSGACKVEIELHWSLSELVVTITDNGKGFNQDDVDSSKHFGLEIMQERAAELNGRITIHPSINVGTVVNFRIPMNLGENN